MLAGAWGVVRDGPSLGLPRLQEPAPRTTRHERVLWVVSGGCDDSRTRSEGYVMNVSEEILRNVLKAVGPCRGSVYENCWAHDDHAEQENERFAMRDCPVGQLANLLSRKGQDGGA
jgi:hypothetical protein